MQHETRSGKSVEHAAPTRREHPMINHHRATCTELCHAMHMNPAQCSSLSFFYSTVFRTTWSKFQIQRYGGEEYFAFWGFISEEHIRNKLLALVSYAFKTRIIIAANTKQGMFECVCTIDSTTARGLHAQYEANSGRLPAATAEDLLLWFLELFNMSADVLRFERILNLQMVSSIDRLEHAKSQLYGNLSSPVVSDFYELYKCKRAYRDDSIAARMLTGYELSTDSLCRLCHALRASQNKYNALKTQLASMREFARIREAEVQPAHQAERFRGIRKSAREDGSTGFCVPRSQRTRCQSKDKVARGFGPLRGAAGTICGNKNKNRARRSGPPRSAGSRRHTAPCEHARCAGGGIPRPGKPTGVRGSDKLRCV